jgi:hypothetical protein
MGANVSAKNKSFGGDSLLLRAFALKLQPFVRAEKLSPLRVAVVVMKSS